jgi:hypothetical protein
VKRLVLAVAPLLLALSACGNGASAGSSSSTPVVQPCDAVDIPAVVKVLGTGLVKHTGTSSSPTCVLTSTVLGGANFSLNYQWWFQGGLEKAWRTIKKQVSGTVTRERVAGADDARLVVNTGRKAAYATGFVETGNLIQVVNAQALPKNAARLRAATLTLMTQIAQGAPASATSPSPTASPAAYWSMSWGPSGTSGTSG